jgi:hypothetical protein
VAMLRAGPRSHSGDPGLEAVFERGGPVKLVVFNEFQLQAL